MLKNEIFNLGLLTFLAVFCISLQSFRLLRNPEQYRGNNFSENGTDPTNRRLCPPMRPSSPRVQSDKVQRKYSDNFPTGRKVTLIIVVLELVFLLKIPFSLFLFSR